MKIGQVKRFELSRTGILRGFQCSYIEPMNSTERQDLLEFLAPYHKASKARPRRRETLVNEWGTANSHGGYGAGCHSSDCRHGPVLSAQTTTQGGEEENIAEELWQREKQRRLKEEDQDLEEEVKTLVAGAGRGTGGGPGVSGPQGDVSSPRGGAK